MHSLLLGTRYRPTKLGGIIQREPREDQMDLYRLPGVLAAGGCFLRQARTELDRDTVLVEKRGIKGYMLGSEHAEHVIELSNSRSPLQVRRQGEMRFFLQNVIDK